MNIFFLDRDPKIAAAYHCDKHVIKMILESAQLLSTAHRVLDGEGLIHHNPDTDAILYRATHINHPSGVWVRESADNYQWVYRLMIELNSEFVRRYNKSAPHVSITKLGKILAESPNNIDWRPGLTRPPLCMPPEYWHRDFVVAYRNYYRGAKARIATWTNAKIPEWFTLNP